MKKEPDQYREKHLKSSKWKPNKTDGMWAKIEFENEIVPPSARSVIFSFSSRTQTVFNVFVQLPPNANRFVR